MTAGRPGPLAGPAVGGDGGWPAGPTGAGAISQPRAAQTARWAVWRWGGGAGQQEGRRLAELGDAAAARRRFEAEVVATRRGMVRLYRDGAVVAEAVRGHDGRVRWTQGGGDE